MGQIVPAGQVCCSNCFADSWLKKQVRGESKRRGTCDYCGSTNEQVLEIEALEDYFKNWFSMYQPHNGEWGASNESLLDWAQWNWEIFSDDLDEGDQGRLLEDILNCRWDDDDGEPPVGAQDLYMAHGSPWHETEVDRWREFCGRVRENPEELPGFPDHVLEDIVDRTTINLDAGTVVFRARIGSVAIEDREEPYSETAMGAPPKEKARSARANREGQRVLYCAEDETTAISEVRPARGMVVSVCTLTLRERIRILDLANELENVNPFLSPYPAYDVEFVDLLASFASEMSEPLRRDDDQRHYLPSQRLCEFFAERGFDGVRYPSALCENGTNLVFFDPDIADIGESWLVEVESVVVHYRKVS